VARCRAFVSQRSVALLCRIALRKSEERGGSFTYTDLHVLTGGVVAETLGRMLLEMCKVPTTLITLYGHYAANNYT